MSLDNIELPGYLCQIMFANSLTDVSIPSIPVNLPLGEVEQNKTNENEIKSLGENEKNILFLINNPHAKFVSDAEMEFLTALLAACKISMADIALVNYHQDPLDYRMISAQFQSKKIFVFGVSTDRLDLPFTIPFFQIQKFQDQLYMTGPALLRFFTGYNLKKTIMEQSKTNLSALTV